jgi:hypothetical protein
LEKILKYKLLKKCLRHKKSQIKRINEFYLTNN